MNFSPLNCTSIAMIILLCLAAISLIFNKHEKFLINLSFPFTIIASLLMIIAGITGLKNYDVYTMVINLGLPDLPFHLRIDSLSGFFLITIGLLVMFVSIYSLDYVKEYIGHRSIAKLIFFYNLFVCGMFMVVLANDALFFLIAWELMAGSSYFLVLFEDEKPENKRAALLYLVIAHIGAIAILLAFGVLAGATGDFTDLHAYTFEAMRAVNPTSELATLAFLLAFFGFSAKAGVVPLHVWLPEAHPVAPSNVSALMSGIMLKTAIYGILRVTFDIIKVFPWWWGVMILIFGVISAILGVLYALMQHDLKKLLAYHSVENIGIILMGIGLSMIFTSFNMTILAAIAMTAAIYHTLNHAMFKGLLFMGAGAVLQATKERDMENMGGLIHLMPWTAFLFLIGCISISALPPLNGFVSEWLTFQAFLLSPVIPIPLAKLILPAGAALLALTGGLAAACFVKVYGVTFLGKWRSPNKPQIKEVGIFMVLGMLLAGLNCLILGIFPTFFIRLMESVPSQLVGASINSNVSGFNWLWLTPIFNERASYSGSIVFVGITATILITFLIFHVKRGAIKRCDTWDCGYGKLTSRMQYSATSFAMPIRKIFGGIFLIKEKVGLKYKLQIRDRFVGIIYAPIIDLCFFIAKQVSRLQQGKIQHYLLYSFVTIIVLLLFLR